MTNTMTVTTMTTAMKIMEGYMMAKMMKLTKTRTTPLTRHDKATVVIL